MAGITGQGTTFNLPNFVGELFAVTPTDTPFLSSIGGLTGGERVTSTLFQWQGYDLRDADETRQRVEGANAPTAEARVRFNEVNVVEIHQEAVETSYTKLAAVGQYDSTGSNHPGSVGIAGSNPVMDEQNWQVQRALEQMARDIERGFITGTLNNPSTNATARRTEGIISATDTNTSDRANDGTDDGTAIGTATIEADDEVFTLASHGITDGDPITVRTLTGGAVGVLKEDDLLFAKVIDANTFTVSLRPGGADVTFDTDGGADVFFTTQLTEDMVLTLLQDVWESGGIMVSEAAALMVGGTLKRRLTKLFITDKGYEEQSRDIGGVHVMTIETDFGTLNVMLNRYMPTSILQVVSLDECAPAFLEIPGKGFLFQEPLARQGSAEREQIYGEIGLKYGNEKAHGNVKGVSAIAPA